ncbi:MAG: hypothetical protein ACLR9W_02670 [Enterobacter hormaechei]
MLGAGGPVLGKPPGAYQDGQCGVRRPITSPSRMSRGCAPAKAKNWLGTTLTTAGRCSVSGERWHYAPLKDDAPSLLQRISEPCGNAILFEWNANNTCMLTKRRGPARQSAATTVTDLRCLAG